MDRIKKIIIVLSIAIVLVIAGLLILKFNIKPEEEEKIEPVENLDIGKTYENNSNGFQILDDGTIFYTITNTLNHYLLALNYQNKDIYNFYNIQNEEQQKEIILSLLDKQYGEQIKEYVDKVDYSYNLIPVDIRVKYGEKIITYLVEIYLENMETMELENKYYVIRTDNQSASFSIEPILEEVKDIDTIAVEDKQDRISSNDYNQYQIETISMERLIKIYMSQFVNMMVNHTELAYDKYLDQEYKKKRFGDVNQFKDYVNKNKEELKKLRATQYLLESDEKGKKYVVKDQYENVYEFNEKSTMSYTVRLDTYTILSDKFKETYHKAREQNKVMMNVDKWIQMLNARDYKNAYELLDETYRNNTFGGEDVFEQKMREVLPLHYSAEYKDFSKEGDTCLLKVTLSDMTKETAESKTISIFMKLLEETDFVMSFAMEE